MSDDRKLTENSLVPDERIKKNTKKKNSENITIKRLNTDYHKWNEQKMKEEKKRKDPKFTNILYGY